MTVQVADTTAPVPGRDGEGPEGTGSAGSRVLGAIALAAVALLVVLAFVATEGDVELGDTVRLLYLHVPVVIAAYLSILLTTVGSVMVLWKRSHWWDLVASSSAEIATLFTALTLFTGSVWGATTWGTWWEWDPRLTSTAMLFLLLLGYLAVRRTTLDQGARARRSAIVGLLLLPNVLLVNRSVEWWRSLHQGPTLFRPDPTIEGLQLFTLVFGIATSIVLMVWLLLHRFRLAWLQDRLEARGLEDALAARRAEAG
ncbi:cytochrome c biogenesis protein CcsA [Rhabdothermincola sediminis]|uniref:cytochrome c biogenesis protein CcsA n=1 Tax=Rhabdothermincola sediminis TaxID=2751370 RepID=UPI001AA09022|nr:cytochrome c biogenesis protein CcsA [Rhabdothermincola sediminis]